MGLKGAAITTSGLPMTRRNKKLEEERRREGEGGGREGGGGGREGEGRGEEGGVGWGREGEGGRRGGETSSLALKAGTLISNHVISLLNQVPHPICYMYWDPG